MSMLTTFGIVCRTCFSGGTAYSCNCLSHSQTLNSICESYLATLMLGGLVGAYSIFNVLLSSLSFYMLSLSVLCVKNVN